jgi:2-iminobutanoate/2-iminopropanoate deaminase
MTKNRITDTDIKKLKMRIITTSKAPLAIGPYSQAVEKNGMLFISGQIPVNPETGAIESISIREQTIQVIKNIEAIIHAAGYTLQDVVKTTCYLSDMNNFSEMNEAYSGFFQNNHPARATVEVSRLPKDVLVEIESIAIK